VFQITCNEGPDAGEITYTSDPGNATPTRQCTDVGRGTGPILRGFAARAPYFHNGAAATLDQVVNFQMGLTEQEKEDLVNFLRALRRRSLEFRGYRRRSANEVTTIC